MRTFALVTSVFFLLVGLAAGQEMKKGDTGRYKVYQGGTEVGEGSFLVADAQGLEIKGDVTLNTPSGKVAIETTTVLGTDRKPKSYYLHATLPGDSTQELDISFEGGKAKALILIGGSQQEQTIEMPQDWIILDNNSLPHQALLISTLDPEMAPEEGKLFVPQRLIILDYSIEPAGETEYTLAGKKITCQVYKMNIAGAIDVYFYVADYLMVAMEQIQGNVKFELVTK